MLKGTGLGPDGKMHLGCKLDCLGIPHSFGPEAAQERLGRCVETFCCSKVAKLLAGEFNADGVPVGSAALDDPPLVVCSDLSLIPL